jgi:hypothetical protein
MIATEAVEDGPLLERVKIDWGKRTVEIQRPLNYNLRLVRNEDGTLDWRDD